MAAVIDYVLLSSKKMILFARGIMTLYVTKQSEFAQCVTLAGDVSKAQTVYNDVQFSELYERSPGLPSSSNNAN